MVRVGELVEELVTVAAKRGEFVRVTEPVAELVELPVPLLEAVRSVLVAEAVLLRDR